MRPLSYSRVHFTISFFFARDRTYTFSSKVFDWTEEFNAPTWTCQVFKGVSLTVAISTPPDYGDYFLYYYKILIFCKKTYWRRESDELDVKIILYQKDRTIAIVGSVYEPAFVPAAKEYFFNYTHIEALISARPTPPRGYPHFSLM